MLNENKVELEREYKEKIKVLEDKLECVYAENQELKNHNEELLKKIKFVEEHNKELLSRAEFYMGQIEAYQYALDCRR